MSFTPSIRHSKCCHTHAASFANTSISICIQQHCHHHTLPTTSVAIRTQRQAFEVLPYTSSIAICKQHQNYHMNCQTLPATEFPASTFHTKHRYSSPFHIQHQHSQCHLFAPSTSNFQYHPTHPAHPTTPLGTQHHYLHPASELLASLFATSNRGRYLRLYRHVTSIRLHSPVLLRPQCQGVKHFCKDLTSVRSNSTSEAELNACVAHRGLAIF